MKLFNTTLAISTLLLALDLIMPTNSHSAIKAPNPAAEIDAWLGQWVGKSTTINIYKLENLLEITGTDKVSSFTYRCTPEENWQSGKIACVGSGHQFDDATNAGSMFTIQSKLDLTTHGVLSESWNARFWNSVDEFVEELSGSETYQRKAPPSGNSNDVTR